LKEFYNVRKAVAMNGYTGHTLWVDLTRRTVSVKTTDGKLVKNVLGGRGMGIQLLTELAPAGVDPWRQKILSPLATGPHRGRVFSAFFNVTAIPLTGIAAASHCGGKWGPA
jgi:aldehyde:ferredoxin oxidoreductase